MYKTALPLLLALAYSAQAGATGAPSLPCYQDGYMIATSVTPAKCKRLEGTLYPFGDEPEVGYYRYYYPDYYPAPRRQSRELPRQVEPGRDR